MHLLWKIKKKPSNNIAKSLVESLSTSKMTEIVTEFSDIAFDMVSNQEDGFLKEIPIFGWFIKGHGAFITTRDRIFMKKIANFLYGTATVSEEDREKFKNDISNDQELSQKVACPSFRSASNISLSSLSILSSVVFTAFAHSSGSARKLLYSSSYN